MHYYLLNAKGHNGFDSSRMFMYKNQTTMHHAPNKKQLYFIKKIN